ncbi:MAG: hypothetical protein H6765_02565 [Candidatus Peribacteria bacterium]|nr:MAG: hypothetical protein H6765_02565 [Candidatus Peribacteria bacterium]
MEAEGKGQTRAREIRNAIGTLSISNSTILGKFKELGIYDASYEVKDAILADAKTHKKQISAKLQLTQSQVLNLSEKLLDIELSDSVLEQIDVLNQTVQESKSFLLQQQFGEGMLQCFPLEKFNQTPKAQKIYAQATEQTPLSSQQKRELIKLYLDWVAAEYPHEKGLVHLMRELRKYSQAKDLNNLPRASKQQLLDIYVDQHLSSLQEQGLGNFLAKYINVPHDKDSVLEQYKDFWKAIYDLQQKEVALPTELRPQGPQ